MPGEPLDAPDDLCKQALSQLAFGQLQVEAGDGAVVSRSRCSLPRLVLVNFLARASALLRGLSGASSLTRRLVVATIRDKGRWLRPCALGRRLGLGLLHHLVGGALHPQEEHRKPV